MTSIKSAFTETELILYKLAIVLNKIQIANSLL